MVTLRPSRARGGWRFSAGTTTRQEFARWTATRRCARSGTCHWREAPDRARVAGRCCVACARQLSLAERHAGRGRIVIALVHTESPRSVEPTGPHVEGGHVDVPLDPAGEQRRPPVDRLGDLIALPFPPVGAPPGCTRQQSRLDVDRDLPETVVVLQTATWGDDREESSLAPRWSHESDNLTAWRREDHRRTATANWKCFEGIISGPEIGTQ